MDTERGCSEDGNPMASCPAVQNSQQLTQKSTASLPTALDPILSFSLYILEKFIPADLT